MNIVVANTPKYSDDSYYICRLNYVRHISRLIFCAHNLTLSNLRFAGEIDLLGGSKDELQELAQRWEMPDTVQKSSQTKKNKILDKSIKPRPSSNIRMHVNVLEVDQFKYLGSIQTTDWRNVIKGRKISFCAS